MKRLKLPVIRGVALRKRHLSMDKYLKFVLFNLKYTFNRKAYEKMKRKAIVDVPFYLKTYEKRSARNRVRGDLRWMKFKGKKI